MTERGWTPRELELAALLLEVTDELEDAANYAGDYLKQKFGWPELVARGRAAVYEQTRPVICGETLSDWIDWSPTIFVPLPS